MPRQVVWLTSSGHVCLGCGCLAVQETAVQEKLMCRKAAVSSFAFWQLVGCLDVER
jgi:hypothetical protein